MSTSDFPFVLNEVDIIPVGDSSEVKENSESSLAVDPLDPRQIIAGAFAYDFQSISDIQQPYFKSTDGGSTWNNYGTINHSDKSLAWLQDGSAALTATLWPFTTPGVLGLRSIPIRGALSTAIFRPRASSRTEAESLTSRGSVLARQVTFMSA